MIDLDTKIRAEIMAVFKQYRRELCDLWGVYNLYDPSSSVDARKYDGAIDNTAALLTDIHMRRLKA